LPIFYDHHWATQVSICNLDRIPYSHIGSIENIDDSLEWLAARLIPNERILNRFAPHSTDSANKIHKFYDDETTQKAYEIYREDFEFFGYSPNVDQLNTSESVSARTERLSSVYRHESLKLTSLYELLARNKSLAELPFQFLDLAHDIELEGIIIDEDWQVFAQLSLRHSPAHLPAFLTRLSNDKSPKSKVIAAQIALQLYDDVELAHELAQAALCLAPWFPRAKAILQTARSV
jgi:hypothetical protein